MQLCVVATGRNWYTVVMPTYETPWGQRTYTEYDRKCDDLLFQMWDEHDEKLSLIGDYQQDVIAQYEGVSMSTLEVVDWVLSEDEKTQKQMIAFIKKVNKSTKDQVKELNLLEVEIEKTCKNARDITLDQKLEAKEFYTDLMVTHIREPLVERLNKNEQLLSLLGIKQSGGDVQSLDFERAKAYPIDQLIQFKAGFAPCCWHNEKTPSMKYYKKNNKVHCFGCGKGGDVIDVIQAIQDCDIKQAVAFLTNA